MGKVSLRFLQRMGLWGETHEVWLPLSSPWIMELKRGESEDFWNECSAGDQISREKHKRKQEGCSWGNKKKSSQCVREEGQEDVTLVGGVGGKKI